MKNPQEELFDLPLYRQRRVNRDMDQGTSEWLAWRDKGIGATDAAAIMGTSHYGTKLSVYSKKLGMTKGQPEQTAVQEWGHRIEPILIDKFVESHPASVTAVERGGLYELEWRRCSLDGFCLFDGEPCIIECKTARSADEWDPLPRGYWTQVQWQMHVTGIRKAFVVCLVAGLDYREVEVDYSESFCTLMEAECSRVWKCIVNHEPPVMDATHHDIDQSAIADISRECDGKPVDICDDDVAKFLLLKERLEEAEEEFQACKTDLMYKMIGGAPLMYNGKKFAFYVTRAGSASIDKNLLKKDYPEVYDKVLTQGASSRYVKFNTNV